MCYSNNIVNKQGDGKMEDLTFQQQFMKYMRSWQPSESPPDTGNWVALRHLDSGHHQVHFDKDVPPTREAIQKLCDKLNREEA